MNKHKLLHWSAGLALLLGVAVIGVYTLRHQTSILLPTYLLTFGAYYFLVAKYAHAERSLFALGVIARLILFCSLPSLSDDIYRFIWDGSLLHLGIDPYAQLPQDLLSHPHIPDTVKDLFLHLNSPQYYTVYPPLNQLLFWVSTSFGQHPLIATNCLRLFVVSAEIGSFFFLRKLLSHAGKSKKWAHWYFLNPLIILEFTGNLHFEAFVIFFLLLGLLLVQGEKWISGGMAFGGAIAMKLLPMIYLPALIFHLKSRKGFLVALAAGTVSVLTFLPLLNTALLHNIQKSLGLYFHHFEFNASIYFLLRQVGFWIKGYNMIGTLGPVLSLISACLILAISYFGKLRGWELHKTLLFTLLCYILMTTTVHPWYIIPMIPLGLLSGYFFPVAWSLLIFTTYAGYRADGFELSNYWVVLEYSCLAAFLFFELKKKK